MVQDKEPKGIIPLENIQIREVQDAKKPHCFELYSVSNEVRAGAPHHVTPAVVNGSFVFREM